MFKRIMPALVFAVTLGGASLCLSDTAEARRWGYSYGRPAYSNYYSYNGPRAYSYGVPYRTYYAPRAYYGPRAYSYGYPGYFYGGPGVSVGIGFGPGLRW